MAQNAFVQSMKTIAESLIRKAGFDKTRSGKVVGVNSLTNTYSVKVDGHVYNNVRVVNDSTYNVGDTVRVNIPVNQMSQAYISASIFSDESIGKKIGHAESLINAIDGTLEDVKEIGGHIYQLDITSVYGLHTSPPANQEYSTHTGILYKDGTRVGDGTSAGDADPITPNSSYYDNFHWYLMISSGKEEQTTGITQATLRLPIDKYLYGMVLILEWVDGNGNVLLRKQTTLIDNSEIADVETTASNAYNIASNAYELADNTDNYFWNVESGTDTGAHMTRVPKDTFIAATTDALRGYNLLAKPEGVALRYGYSELAQFTYDKLTFNALYNGNLYKNMELTTSSLTFYDGTSNGIELAKFNGDGMVLKNSSGYKTTESGNNGFILYDGTSLEKELASFRASGSVIGKTGETHLTMDFHSLEMKDKNGNTYFDVRDLRDDKGKYVLVKAFTGDNSTTNFKLTSDLVSYIDSISSAMINGSTVSPSNYSLVRINSDYYISFNSAPTTSAIIEVSCITTVATLKVYTAGTRSSNSIYDYGFMSFAEGYRSKAKGDASHAEGYSSQATEFCSHAEGYSSKAFGDYSHAEGYSTLANTDASHAEGNNTTASGEHSHAEGYSTEASENSAHAEGGSTIASGEYSHAEGYGAESSGTYSHASGYYTKANTILSNVIGMYNIMDTNNFQKMIGYYRCNSSDYTKTTITIRIPKIPLVISVYYNGVDITYSQSVAIASESVTITRMAGVVPVFEDGDEIEIYSPMFSHYPFIIGNGTSDSSRSNAFSVSWDGDVTASGDMSIGGDITTQGNVSASGINATGNISTTGDVDANDIIASGNVASDGFLTTKIPFATVSGTSATADGTFAETSVTLAASGNIGAGDGSGSINETATLNNYYPIAISGWNGDNRHCMLSDCDISSRSLGSATIHGYITNTSDSDAIPQANAKVVVHILWIKAN